MRDNEKQAWITMLTRVHDSDAWKGILTKNDWTDAFMTGDQFAKLPEARGPARRQGAERHRHRVVDVLRGRLADSADRLAGATIGVFGAWFLWQAAILREGPGYAAVGPVCSRLSSASASWRAGWHLGVSPTRRPEAESDVEPERDWRTLAGAAAILAGYVVLFQPLGFVVASTLFLAANSWNLGSRSFRRDIVAGPLTSAAAYLVFTYLLGLELPAGPLP